MREIHALAVDENHVDFRMRDAKRLDDVLDGRRGAQAMREAPPRCGGGRKSLSCA